MHEYGGGAYAVRAGVIVYTELSDGRIHRIENGEKTQPITPAGAYRYGDLRGASRPWPGAGRTRGPFRYRRTGSTRSSPLDLPGPNAAGGTVLCSRADFYSTPELSPSGRLAWTQWDHPNMPWDAAGDHGR